ncbi:MAG: hypothetical protein JWQ89_622 [Devosia sp.]|uniref:hypothetical protein n=1 Tax=Devosia sp. TaxID=1871048 RepID=UPI0026189880|nr:hypothetical protein [Devosia sp.]MDB5538895.1 hypothetical protein [Devosia sp.]
MVAMQGDPAIPDGPYAAPAHVGDHGDMVTVGEVDYAANDFDPSAILTNGIGSLWKTNHLFRERRWRGGKARRVLRLVSFVGRSYASRVRVTR